MNPCSIAHVICYVRNVTIAERAILFPLGHPIELEAPSSIVEISCSRWPEAQRFDVAPLQFRWETGQGESGPAEFLRRPDGFAVRDGFGNAGEFRTQAG